MDTDVGPMTSSDRTTRDSMAMPDFSYICTYHLLPLFVAEKHGSSIRDFRVIWLNVVAKSLYAACVQQASFENCDDWFNTRLEDFLTTIFRNKDVVDSYFEILSVAAEYQTSVLENKELPTDATSRGISIPTEPSFVDRRDEEKRFQIYTSIRKQDSLALPTVASPSLPIFGCRSIKQGGFPTCSSKPHHRTADLTTLLWIDSTNGNRIKGLQGTMPLTNEQVQEALRTNPLQYLWSNTRDWFTRDHDKVPHEFNRVRTTQFNAAPKHLDGYPYEFEITEKLGFRMPVAIRRAKQWDQMTAFHESLKFLTGACYNGNTDTDCHNLNLGSVLILSLMAVKSLEDGRPLPDKWLHFPQSSLAHFAPFQQPEDAKALAEALLNLFKCVFEFTLHSPDGVREIGKRFDFRFEEPVNGGPSRLIYNLAWDASELSPSRMQTLASKISQAKSDDGVVESTAGAIRHAAHCLQKCVAGYGSGGRLILHKKRLIFEAVPNYLRRGPAEHA